MSGCEDCARWEAEVARMREALIANGAHDQSCRATSNDVPADGCTCALSVLADPDGQRVAAEWATLREVAAFVRLGYGREHPDVAAALDRARQAP